jgi:nitrogen fixation protein NifB
MGGAVRFVENRPVPAYCHAREAAGCGGEGAIGAIIETISDCAAVLCLRVGEVPRAALAERGIRAMMHYDFIEDAVREAAETVFHAEA